MDWYRALVCSLTQMTEAAEFFGMSEGQKDTLLGGAVMAAFFVVGAPASLLVSGWDVMGKCAAGAVSCQTGCLWWSHAGRRVGCDAYGTVGYSPACAWLLHACWGPTSTCPTPSCSGAIVRRLCRLPPPQIGWLTDRGGINRRTLLFWVVVIGEFPCLLTYWVSAGGWRCVGNAMLQGFRAAC